MIQANQRLAIATISSTSFFRQPEGYRMRASTGIWWRDKLASWCWTLLHKLRAIEPYGFHENVYTYTPSQQKEITSRLMEGIDQVFRRGGDIADYCIVLGGNDFSEMMNSEAIRNMVTLATSEVRYQTRDGYRLEYRGLPVHVVPNVSGAAVFPKVIVEKVVPKKNDGFDFLGEALNSGDGTYRP